MVSHLDDPVDGYIYGQPPPVCEDRVPNVKDMFEAVGLPDVEPGKLPYTLDWYAGAKDRAKAREIEKDMLLERKNDLRHSWAELVMRELAEAYDRVCGIMAEPEPLDLQLVRARVAHERPKDKEAVEDLRRQDAEFTGVRQMLKDELTAVRERLKTREIDIQRHEEDDQAKEDARKAEVAEERERKARMKRALARNEKRLRGEECPDTDEEEQAIAAAAAAEAAPGDDSEQKATGSNLAAATTQAPGVPTSLPPQTGALPPLQDPPLPAGPANGSAAAGVAPALGGLPPRAARGGLAQQLPPLQSPPPPPPA
eukprot:TRINITY_DN6474_c0_g1_i1.p1 TRINITY_DN6474_c0_g1~~TRINITY_DN6474_c0_g1_i1.p1  ORF type:complete len:312 (-),score=89.17 TRINITY_DN6474_c0_g1_i1:48-983(-)